MHGTNGGLRYAPPALQSLHSVPERLVVASFERLIGSQLALCQCVAQDLLDAGIVAPAGSADCLHDIGCQPKPNVDFGHRDRRPT